MSKTKLDQSKRDFIKKSAYTTPVIVTMAAIPSFASAGSGWQQPVNSHPSNGGHSNAGSHGRGRQHRNGQRNRNN